MLLVSGLAFISPARSDSLDNFAELEKSLGAGKFADVEQRASQMLANDPDSPLASRVRVVRARSRVELKRVPEAVEDYLAAIERAESDQRKAAVYLELASTMQRLNYGDHACAAIRRALDVAGSEESPMGQLATARNRENGCPGFADQDFDRLFQLPFRTAATTEGKLAAIFGDTAAVRFPNDWALDAAGTSADEVTLSSAGKDGTCAIRRADGTAPIKDYLEAVGREPYAAGRRPGGILLGVVGREGRMGSARAVEIDFRAAPGPGRLYLATRLGKTYSVLCWSPGGEAAARMRRAAQMIAESMRWAS